MSKLRTIVLTTGAAVAGLITLAVGGLALLSQGVCDYEWLNEIPSQDGSYIADVTFRDCGRDVGFYYLVSLRRSSTEVSDDGEPDHVVGIFRDEYELWPYWAGNELVIPYIHVEPRIARDRWRDVTIVKRHEPNSRSPFTR